MICIEIARHMVNQIVRNHCQLISLFIEFRLILAHPLHLRAGKHRINPGAAEPENLSVMFLHSLTERHRPLILPHLGVSQMVSFPVHRNDGRTLGGKGDSVDTFFLLCRKRGRLLYNLRHAVLEIQRILLHPAVLQGDDLVFLLYGMKHRSILAEQNSAHA